MIEEYIKMVQEIFPSIEPETAKNLIKSIKQFTKEGRVIDFFSPNPFEKLAQGDILKDILFSYISTDGDQQEFIAPGVMLSNTCDANNKRLILFSPLLQIKDAKEKLDIDAIKNNKYNALLYFPNSIIQDHYVDLSIINTYSSELILNLLEKNNFEKMYSLSQIGYYFFITKLTIHLLRPEDLEFLENRNLEVN